MGYPNGVGLKQYMKYEDTIRTVTIALYFSNNQVLNEKRNAFIIVMSFFTHCFYRDTSATKAPSFIFNFEKCRLLYFTVELLVSGHTYHKVLTR